MEYRFGIKLTEREVQVCELLLTGAENPEIAKELHVKLRTVKSYFRTLFLLFGVEGGVKRVQLATLLYRKQLYYERYKASMTAILPAVTSRNSCAR